MTIHTPLSERRRPLTPEEHQYVEQYLVPKWRRKHLLRQFRTQLDEFFESSEEKWDAQISEPLDAWSVFRSLYWRLQRRGLENKTEIKIVGGKIVSICKL